MIVSDEDVRASAASTLFASTLQRPRRTAANRMPTQARGPGDAGASVSTCGRSDVLVRETQRVADPSRRRRYAGGGGPGA